MSENGAIKFDFTAMQWEGLTEEQLDLWCKLYPNVDVPNELRLEMTRWLDRHVIRGPEGELLKVNRKARKKNWKAFIVGWLKRAEVRGLGI